MVKFDKKNQNFKNLSHQKQFNLTDWIPYCGKTGKSFNNFHFRYLKDKKIAPKGLKNQLNFEEN